MRLAPAPLSAAEMVLIRLIYAQDLPTPGDAIKTLASRGAAPAAPMGAPGGGGGGARMAVGESLPPQAMPPAPTMRAAPLPETGAVILPASFEALAGFLSEQRSYNFV